ncbi:unnamed protein product [Thelazia callipaeda]|uniref:ShTK domain protein n=1 Tax=Thelazia callipaeda TaxID=103827 RepID=A0A0N5CJE8_THECL|nr:unnamed protein product [Thelazia callipaeda]
MIETALAYLFCHFSILSATPLPERQIWYDWDEDRVPFAFSYERRPDWCVDEDPLCSMFKGWCVSINKTRENYMKKACRRTCNMCYEEMNSTRTCYDKEDDCVHRESDCFAVETAERMYHACPETCGFCNSVCADLATNCGELVSYCTASLWHQAVMQSKCRMTCSFCRVYDRENFEPEQCSDKFGQCHYQRHLCERIEFQERMQADCAHTCGYCDFVDTVSDIPKKCSDLEIDCRSKIHFCFVEGRHSFYMWRNCKRTCGYCADYYFEKDSDYEPPEIYYDY